VRISNGLWWKIVVTKSVDLSWEAECIILSWLPLLVMTNGYMQYRTVENGVSMKVVTEYLRHLSILKKTTVELKCLKNSKFLIKVRIHHV